jgi:hypothetical protein
MAAERPEFSLLQNRVPDRKSIPSILTNVLGCIQIHYAGVVETDPLKEFRKIHSHNQPAAQTPASTTTRSLPILRTAEVLR